MSSLSLTPIVPAEISLSALGIGSNNRVTTAVTFTAMPEVHAVSGDATPIYGRTSTDGKTVAAWNLIHDGVEGDLFHFTTGENSVSNANGAVIAIGVDEAGTGIVVQNKKTGQGITLNQLDTITSATAYMMNWSQQSSTAAFLNIVQSATGSQPVIAYTGTVAPAAALFLKMNSASVGGSTLAGQIYGNTGLIDWRRTIQTVAPNSSGTPLIRVADEVADTPTETYIAAKTNGEAGLVLYRWSGSGTSMFGYKIVTTSDRLKIQVGQGPANKGSETLSTMIEFRNTAGTGNLGQMGFFGATPVNRPAAIASPAADATELKTAVDAIRVALTNLGLTA